MKKVLGLDIGTNSIGWAFIEQNIEEEKGSIIGLGSRILPVSGDVIKDFQAGQSVSAAADRRGKRGARRLLQRYRLRRSRLIKTLKLLGYLPQEFPDTFKNISKFNINDYLPFSEQTKQEAFEQFGSDKIPGDWIIYYLRSKALHKKITLQELSRILYQLNQKRGFRSSKKDITPADDDENKSTGREKRIEIVRVKKVDKQLLEDDKKNVILLTLELKDGQLIEGKFLDKVVPEPDGDEIEIEISTNKLKSGEVKTEFRYPDRTDWMKLKIARDKALRESGMHPGEYYYNNLLADRNYIIKERIIDRSFFVDELKAIWAKQSQFHKILNSKDELPLIAGLLYKHNIEKQKEIATNDLLYLFLNDIIYYQRGLKSQKHLIGKCRYETKKDDKGNVYGVRVIHKSAPLFQEFRIWQDILSLKIIQNELRTESGKIKTNIDISDRVLTPDSLADLFDLFNTTTKISQKAVLKALSTKELKLDPSEYHTNFPDTKEFKGNSTKNLFRKIFRKYDYESEGEKVLNDPHKFELLWHITYSLEEVKDIYSSVNKHFNFPIEVSKAISQLPEYPSEYASLSSKAIKKLLPLMRCGKYFNFEEIDQETKLKINAYLDNDASVFPEPAVAELKKKKISTPYDFSGFLPSFACYIVYGRHSERESDEKYQKPEDINIARILPQGSLRNPIVEKITRETLALVSDVWKHYGRPDEIHIELARDLKNNKEDRKKIFDENTKREREIERIKEILKELKNANPDSPADVIRLRLWEETGNLQARASFPSLSKQPSKTEITKYKLWGEQNHISPYTGRVIPLSKLFTEEYEIEHIFPRSRFYDDSFGNKTICEAAINKFKDNYTAMQLINRFGGTEITTASGEKYYLLSPEEYLSHVKSTFFGRKRKHLLSEDVPEDFVSRQLNDTRYIGKKLSELLYPVVKSDIIFTSGSITSDLRKQWGLINIWKEILLPRFKRLEDTAGISLVEKGENNETHFLKDYKRVDHRHHALDALVVAATHRSHIQYLNSLNSFQNKREEMQKFFYLLRSKTREFKLPWHSFTKDTKDALQEIFVSHKANNRFLTKRANKYYKWVKEKNGWKKEKCKQVTGEIFSPRVSLFKEPLGLVNIAEYKNMTTGKAIEIQFKYLTEFKNRLQSRIADPRLREKVNHLIKNCSFDLNETMKFLKKHPLIDDKKQPIKQITVLQFNEYSAKRTPLDKTITIKKIDNIPYSGHSKLAETLRAHLNEYNGDSAEAFSGEGLKILYQKWGRPIKKITRLESVGSKINLNGKLLEADTNLFFAIYENIETGKRDYETLPLLDIINRRMNRLPVTDEREGYKTLLLSPNDIVYVPSPEENVNLIDWDDKKKISKRLYRVVSFSGKRCYFLPQSVADLIITHQTNPGKGEFSTQNKDEKSIEGIKIVDVCFKIRIDRLGNLIK